MKYDRAAAGPVTAVTIGGELFKLAATGRAGHTGYRGLSGRKTSWVCLRYPSASRFGGAS